MTDSQNPFDALGGGGFDMNALLQQAQQLQEQLANAQEQLAQTTVEGSVAGGAVTVSLSGVGELQSVTIQPGTVDGDDAESLSDLGDLIVAAFRDAKARADQIAQGAMGGFGDVLGGGDQAGGTGGSLGFGLPGQG